MIEKRERFAVCEVTRGVFAEHDPVSNTYKVIHPRDGEKRISAEEFLARYEIEGEPEKESPEKKSRAKER